MLTISCQQTFPTFFSSPRRKVTVCRRGNSGDPLSVKPQGDSLLRPVVTLDRLRCASQTHQTRPAPRVRVRFLSRVVRSFNEGLIFSINALLSTTLMSGTRVVCTGAIPSSIPTPPQNAVELEEPTLEVGKSFWILGVSNVVVVLFAIELAEASGDSNHRLRLPPGPSYRLRLLLLRGH
jgi:hypothetical protein